jgi:hypothetical protein
MLVWYIITIIIYNSINDLSRDTPRIRKKKLHTKNKIRY